MNDALKKMLGAYDLSTVASVTDALREVIQEIALLGLSRSSFFCQGRFLRRHGTPHVLWARQIFGGYGLFSAVARRIVFPRRI